MRLTRFTPPFFSTPRQTVYRRPGGKLCVGFRAIRAPLQTDSACVPPCKSAKPYDATTYTQFATWAAHTIRCRWLMYGCLKWVRRLFARWQRARTRALAGEAWGRWGPVDKGQGLAV